MPIPASTALASPELFGTSAAAIMIDAHGAQCVNWEPESLEMSARSMCRDLDPGVMDRLNAAMAVLGSDVPHWDVVAFGNTVKCLNFDKVDTSTYVPPELDDCAWGCTEMRLLEGPEDYKKEGFISDIRVFVGGLLLQNGITDVPKALSFADISESRLLNRDDNLGSDSVMFESYWSEQRDKNKEIKELIRSNMVELINQLSGIAFTNSDDSFRKQAEHALRALAI